jgi:hypothetical protein
MKHIQLVQPGAAAQFQLFSNGIPGRGDRNPGNGLPIELRNPIPRILVDNQLQGWLPDRGQRPY